jgi:carnitine 3-dehydrogenase
MSANVPPSSSVSPIAPWQSGDVVPAPLDIYSCRVEKEWVDYNGHMTEAAYLSAFGWGSDALFTYIGDNDDYRAAGNSFYTVETHIVYEDEAFLDEPLRITTQVLDVDTKRLHIHHTMHNATTAQRLATTEQMLVHVDIKAGNSSPISPNIAAALSAIVARHSTLPTPTDVGRVMKIKKK